MSRLSDARSVRSRQALRHALLQLMERAPFDQITIRDVVAAAKVSYPTFYRHYDAKEALLADCARAEIDEFMALPFAMTDPAKGATAGEVIATFVDARRVLWRTLLSGAAAPVMREAFIRSAQEIAERGPRMNPRFPADLMAGVVASGLFEIIAWWLRRPGGYPIGEVAVMLNALVITPATRPPRAAASPPSVHGD